MRKRILAALLAMALLCMGAAALAETGAVTLNVQGTATVTAAPDMVSISARAASMAGTGLEAQHQVADIVNAVTGKLIELGVAQEDIITENYACYPQYNYSGESPVLTGYEASHTLTITCRDVEMLDSVLGVVSDNGVGELYSVHYDISDRMGLYHQALGLAYEAANEKAETLAAAAGLNVTGIVSIEENAGYDYGVTAKGADNATMSARAESFDSGISADAIRVKASVKLVVSAQRK